MKFTRAQAVALCHVSLQYAAEVELEIIDSTPERHAVMLTDGQGTRDIWWIRPDGSSDKQVVIRDDPGADEAL